MASNPRTSGASETSAPEPTSSPSVDDIRAEIENDPLDTTVKPVVEDRDNSKRIRAIPYENGSTVRVSKADFANHGVNYHSVEFDFRRNDMTLRVVEKETSETGIYDENVILAEVADWLTKKFPSQFEYVN